MNTNSKEIIVPATIDNEPKQIILFRDNPASTVYHIMIDKVYQGQIVKNISGWCVHSIQGSFLKIENHDVMLKAVKTAESPKS